MKTNPRVRRILTALVVMVLMTAFFVLTRVRHADSLFINGTIHTLDGSNRTVEALAVADGRILAVGTTADVRSQYDADTTIDLTGSTVIPGFVDAHGRLLSAGFLALTLDLSRAGSTQEAIRLVKQHAAAIPAGTWIRGRGWRNAWWQNETGSPRSILDGGTTAHPVFLVGEDGETAWVNTPALQESGIGRRRTEHEPATIVRDRDGEPIGILLGEASTLVGESMPPPTEWELGAALDSAAAICLGAGITTVHDFGATEREIGLYKKRIAEGTMPLRVYAVIGGGRETWDAFRPDGPLVGAGDNRLTIAAMELFVDGALESRGAALIEPYADDPTTRGVTFADEEELVAATRLALESGFQVCLNARGDRAVRIALNVAAGQANPAAANIRLDGLQLATPEDLSRAGKMGVGLSMQPAQYLLDFDIAALRLGPERMKRFLPWPEALSAGLPVSGGTDLPIGPADPFLGISLVVERCTSEGPGRSSSEQESLKVRLDALRMFTTWSARAGREEIEKGTLEEGKLADFLILSDDPLRVPAEEISRIQVQVTVLGGRVVSSLSVR